MVLGVPILKHFRVVHEFLKPQAHWNTVQSAKV